MRDESIKDYIAKRLEELEDQKDLTEIVQKGKFSFGMEAATYQNLPAWNDLVKKKKQLVKTIWINGFFVSLMIVLIIGDFGEKFAQNWLKALFGLIVVSGITMLLYIVSSYYNLFYHFRQTEREVRKLIYQDILQQLEKEEKEFA